MLTQLLGDRNHSARGKWMKNFDPIIILIIGTAHKEIAMLYLFDLYLSGSDDTVSFTNIFFLDVWRLNLLQGGLGG